MADGRGDGPSGRGGHGRHAAPVAHPGERRLFLVAAAVVAVIVLALGAASLASGDDDAGRLTAGPDSSIPAPGSSTVDVSSAPGSSTSASGSGTTGTTRAPATTTTRPKGGKGAKAITLAFAGDLLPHAPLNDKAAEYGRQSGQPYDYRPMLAPMKGILSGADVAICHMEVPLAPPGERITSYPAFGAPPELVDAVKASGYDGCSNGSNHSLDRGQAGIATTLERFDKVGLKHTGIARSPEEAAAVTTYDVKGVTVAHFSYAYGFNGYEPPADATWSVNPIDVARIKADTAKARAAGADLVVVSLHWGTEYDSDPSQYQHDIAAQLVPSPDIDLIIGCHAHVVQPVQQVGGTFVVWGMGNQLSNMTQPERRDGLTVKATATRGADGRWKVAGVEGIPTWVEPGSFRVLPVVDTLADRSIPPVLRGDLSGSYDRSVAILNPPANAGVTVAPKP